MNIYCKTRDLAIIPLFAITPEEMKVLHKPLLIHAPLYWLKRWIKKMHIFRTAVPILLNVALHHGILQGRESALFFDIFIF